MQIARRRGPNSGGIICNVHRFFSVYIIGKYHTQIYFSIIPIFPKSVGFLLGVFLLGYFCVLLGVFAWVFLRVSVDFVNTLPNYFFILM